MSCRSDKAVVDAGRWCIRLDRSNWAIEGVEGERDWGNGGNAPKATGKRLARLRRAIERSRGGVNRKGIVWSCGCEDLSKR